MFVVTSTMRLIFNREGEVVQKVWGKRPIAFFREQLVSAGL